MTFSPNISKLKEQRSFKRRGLKNIKNLNLRFGDGALLFSQEGRFELKYFKFLKRSFKKLQKFKNNQTFFLKKKVWIPISTNFPITKKAKNSRMGKGKGSFLRWVIRVKSGNKFIETKNLSTYRLLSLKKNIERHVNINLVVLNKQLNLKKHYITFSRNYFWYF